jgi:hypothetical protein
MKRVDLGSMESADSFCKMLDLELSNSQVRPSSQKLVNRINQDLGWNIKGKGSQVFAFYLHLLAKNFVSFCLTDDRGKKSGYKLCVESCYRNIKDSPLFIERSHLIELPSWIAKPPSFIQRHGNC